MGSNAIHSASEVLARIAEHETDTVDVDGLQFRESFQVVGIEGGVQGKHNVVPDRCTITVNRRFAPKYTPEEAEAQVRELLEGADDIEILQAQLAAPPNLTDPLVDEFVSGLSLPVRPKLGWTDVARFAAVGIPAINFGPGDPNLAHKPDEHVEITKIRAGAQTLHAWLTGQPAPADQLDGVAGEPGGVADTAHAGRHEAVERHDVREPRQRTPRPIA